MQPGKWEMTVQTEMPGMAFTIPPMEYSVCLTAQDMVPQRQDARQKCRMIENKVAGDTVSWVMECRDAKTVTRSKGRITYHGSSMDGTVQVSTEGGEAGSMTMNQKISGKRLGPCGK